MSYQVQQMNEAKRIRKSSSRRTTLRTRTSSMSRSTWSTSSQEAYEAVPESKRMEVRYYTVDDVLCDSNNVVIEDVNGWIGEMGAQSTLGYSHHLLRIQHPQGPADEARDRRGFI